MISVVIPIYNYEQYLQQAVDSVVQQSYADLELVLFDDCSKDQSFTLAQTLAEQHRNRFSNIIVRQNAQNMGAHATINAAIRAASGSHIAILNADDRFEPDRFTQMMQAMQAQDARWAFSAIRCMDAQGNALHTPQAESFCAVQRHIEGKAFALLGAVAENVSISTGNLLFEKSLFEEIGGFANYKYVHDYEFFVRACLICEPAFVPQTAYRYRLHDTNSFRSLAAEGLRENRVVWLELYRDVRKRNAKNPVMLARKDYVQDVKEAVYALGRKKKVLWTLAGNPLFLAALRRYKNRHGMDSTSQ